MSDGVVGGGANSLVVVAGPTGSGKSRLAMYLAERFGGEIVNCDSLQLYRGFDIGTAKPGREDRVRVPHHLVDVLDPQVVFSAGDYARMAREALKEISGRGRLAFVVGGTGFYLRALLEGIPALPGRDEDLRSRLALREERRPGSLHRLLRRLDGAAAARMDARDLQKTMRALEIRLLTGSAAPSRDSGEGLRGYRVLQLGLGPDRGGLRKALAERTRAMFEAGLLDEVRGLLAGGLSGDEKPFESLGYRQALACVRGEMGEAQAMESTEVETRQYAKRQMTWFRRERGMEWLAGFGNEARVMEQAEAMVRELVANGRPVGERSPGAEKTA